MKVIELFAGIGAPTMALKSINIPYETVGISEIDQFAIKAYNLIHGETVNFGDISKIEQLPPCDFLHASSPCQSFCDCGKHDGIKGESGLIFEFYRLLEKYQEQDMLPKYISYENVPELKNVYTEVFVDLCDRLEKLGYNVYHDILESYNFGNPTTRKRLFLIAIRKDMDKGKFSMPQKGNVKESMEEYLLDNVDKKFYVEENVEFSPAKRKVRKKNQRIGYLIVGKNKASQTNRVFARNECCPCICRKDARYWIPEGDTYRRLTPKELWLISGYSEEDYQKIEGQFATTRMGSLIGNSISLGPLQEIYRKLFESQE